MNTQTTPPKTPIKVKLGSTGYGFYNSDTDKEFTTIQKDKMTYNVLTILSADRGIRLQGTIEKKLSDSLLELQPDLAVNDYGESTTLQSLLKDLRKGDLVEENDNYQSSKVQITDLGISFLKHNVIED